MIRPLLALMTGLVFVGVAQAELTEVSLANWAGFTLDVDGDGSPEFEGTTSNVQNISLTNYADGNTLTVQNIPGARPGQGTVGSSWTFATIGALQADSIYAGDLSLNPLLFGDLHLAEGVAVVFNANAAEPIVAGWRFGTLGSGSDPLTIVGFVLDATEFFQSGGTNPIKLYTHLYGNIDLGDPPLSVSLETALNGGGAGGPAMVLPMSYSFTAPKVGSITVPSVLGKSYELRRTTNLTSSTLVETKVGTGGDLTFNVDDSGKSDPKAFFFVKEI